MLKKEKHVLLPSLADAVIEQGYLQSIFGVYSVRIENAGVRRPPSDDDRIQRIANPHAFRMLLAVPLRLSNMRGVFARQVSTVEDAPTPRIGHSSVASMSPRKPPRHDSFPHTGEMAILQKLEEVGSSVKVWDNGVPLFSYSRRYMANYVDFLLMQRGQSLIEEQKLQTPELAD